MTSSSSATATQQELKQQGNVHFQNDDFEKAIEFYTQAINLDPAGDATVPILSNRSLCYYNIEKFKEAYEDAGCCCGLKPDWAKGFARRGFAAMKLEEFEIALESFDEYLKLTNENDEMGVAEPRHRATKEVNAAKSRENAALRAARAADEKLKSIADEDERYAHACFMFYEGASNFVKYKETMRVAAKHCRLDTPFFRQGYDDHNLITFDHFLKSDIAQARGALQDPSMITSLSTLGLAALHGMYYRVRENQKHLTEITDFLVDLTEAEENYSPLCAEGNDDSDFEMKKRARLFAIVFEDNDVVSHVWDEWSAFVDFVLTLMNRGKLLLFGKNSRVSDKEFSTRLLRKIMTEACGPDGQDIYEILLILLNAGANANGFIKNSGLEQFPILDCAVHCRSVKIIELLLRNGADVKCVDGESALLEALKLGQLEIAQLLLVNGAELETEETPQLVFERTENDPGLKLCASLLKPRMCHKLKDVFVSDHFVNGSPEVKEGVVSLVLRALKAQHLSLYFDDGHKCLETPLTALLLANASPQFIRHIVNLMDAASINASRSISLTKYSKGHDVLTLAAMGLTTSSSKSIDNFKEIARILLEGGFDYDRAKADVGRWYPFLVEPLLNTELIEYCDSVNAEVKAKRNTAK